jgi:hypothetical protein
MEDGEFGKIIFIKFMSLEDGEIIVRILEDASHDYKSYKPRNNYNYSFTGDPLKLKKILK